MPCFFWSIHLYFIFLSKLLKFCRRSTAFAYFLGKYQLMRMVRKMMMVVMIATVSVVVIVLVMTMAV